MKKIRHIHRHSNRLVTRWRKNYERELQARIQYIAKQEQLYEAAGKKLDMAKITSSLARSPVSVEYVPPDSDVWFSRRYPKGCLHVRTPDRVHFLFGADDECGFMESLEIVAQHVTHDMDLTRAPLISGVEYARILVEMWPQSQAPHGEAKDAVFLHSDSVGHWDLDFVCCPSGLRQHRMLMRLSGLESEPFYPIAACLLPAELLDNTTGAFAKFKDDLNTFATRAFGTQIIQQTLHWRLEKQTRETAPHMQCVLISPDGPAEALQKQGALMTLTDLNVVFNNAVRINHGFKPKNKGRGDLFDLIYKASLELYARQKRRVDLIDLLHCAWNFANEPCGPNDVEVTSRRLSWLCRHQFDVVPALQASDGLARRNELIDQMFGSLLSITRDAPEQCLSCLQSMIEEEVGPSHFEKQDDSSETRFFSALMQSSPQKDAFFERSLAHMENILSSIPDMRHESFSSIPKTCCLGLMETFFNCLDLPDGPDFVKKRFAEPLSSQNMQKILEWLRQTGQAHPGAANVLEQSLIQRHAQQVMREMLAQEPKDSSAEAANQQQAPTRKKVPGQRMSMRL